MAPKHAGVRLGPRRGPFSAFPLISPVFSFLLHKALSGTAGIVDFPSATCTSQMQVTQLTDFLRRTAIVFRIDQSGSSAENDTRSVECVATVLLNPPSPQTREQIQALQRSKKRGPDGDVKDSSFESYWGLAPGADGTYSLSLSCVLNSRDTDQLSLKEHHHFQMDLGESGQIEMFSYSFPDDPLIDTERVGNHIRALKQRLLDGGPSGDSDVDANITDTQFLTFLTLIFCPDNTPEFLVRKFSRCLEAREPAPAPSHDISHARFPK